MAWGEGKAVFLVKINLPPFYSLLLLLFVHAFLPLSPHFPPSLPFLPPSFLPPSSIDCIPLHTWEGRWWGLRWMGKRDWERLLSHLFCVAMSYLFKCTHLVCRWTSTKLKKLPSGGYFLLLAHLDLFISHKEGMSQRYSLSFHHYISPGGNS